MNKKVLIIGAGGHAKVIADIVQKSEDIVVGFLDDNANRIGESFFGSEILGTVSDYKKYAPDTYFIIALGNNTLRKELSKEICGRWYTAIHPSAIIGKGVDLGEGSFIGAGVIINADATVGKHTIINTCSVIEHDCTVEDYAHLAPHTTMCGGSSVGELSLIGAGAVLTNGSRVGIGTILEAGTIFKSN